MMRKLKYDEEFHSAVKLLDFRRVNIIFYTPPRLFFIKARRFEYLHVLHILFIRLVGKCRSPIRQIPVTTKFLTVTSTIYGSSLETCFTSPFWHLEFKVAPRFVELLYTPR